MKIALVRGSYFNKFEMQNYEPLAKRQQITGFSGLGPIHQKYSFPLVKLLSPVDLPGFPYKMPILNRLCFGDAMYLLNLERKLKGFDLVHVRETYFHFTQQALRAKKSGFVRKVVCTCSETIPFNHEGIWNRKRFKEKAIKEVDFFHCLTQKAKKCLVKEGCNPEKIIVFPYGVDLKRFRPQKKAQKQSTLINILFVGRLVKEKGIYNLFKMFNSIDKSIKNIKLTIIGNGPEKDKLINLINQRNLEKKIEIKTVSYGEIPSEYSQADIFCLFSQATTYWEEYLGMALIEAIASGLPVIATLSGAIPEVLGQAGILIPENNWQAGAQALKKLILNAKLRRKLGKQARTRAERLYDQQKITEKINSFWETALKD